MPAQAFVVSDLHIGGGQADEALEDFLQDTEFVRFVDTIAHPNTTLIINGDFIDFAHIPPYVVPRLSHLLWTEQTSLKKLEAAVQAHQTPPRHPFHQWELKPTGYCQGKSPLGTPHFSPYNPPIYYIL